ncbi:hypothetical protein QP948_08800 [Corynebacterium bovis]|uniref:LOG family protein n=1 Tax=Corynebacterium bovis TaxID=36808 RepID=UPI0025506ADF|nr:hypothetical protein [Corynebacterium bovis]MDK8511484.1 hypothetical protein [Corynebacterium bovis]
MRVAVYVGSSPGDGPGFAEAAREVVRGLADAGHSLVYGGGRAGLMGVVGDTAVAAGMDVLGVTTRALVDGETAHTGPGTGSSSPTPRRGCSTGCGGGSRPGRGGSAPRRRRTVTASDGG